MDGRKFDKNELLALLLEEEGIDVSPTQIIPRRQDSENLALSFSQQRLWFINQLEPDSACYNEPTGVRLRGPLDVSALKQNIREIGMRHEVLRTTFKAVEGKPVQVIQETVSLEFTVENLENVIHNEQNAAIEQRALEVFGKPFNLTGGPLWRVKLLRLDREDHVLLLSMHHTISDGWAVGVFFRELEALYEASSNGKPAALPELPIQYADFAQWQRQNLTGDVLEDHLAYWKHRLSGSLPTLELPTDRPRPPVQTFRGARYYFSLPSPLSQAIKTLSHREGVTPFMTLLAAYQALLHRYTGQDDILVGSPIGGRSWPEVEGLIGCFLNTLVLRTDLSGDPSFQGLLARVREMTLGAYAHQDLPFERLVEELHVNRDASLNPLFQVMFVLQNALTLNVPGLSLERLKLDRGAAPLDLILSLEDTDQGIAGWMEYSTDLFDRATIVRLAGHFQTLLESVVADSQKRISELPILMENERRQLLIDWNNTYVSFPRGLCLHQMFEAQVERTPDAIAVVFENKHLTYRELNHRANQLAHYLRNHGVGPDVLAGLCVERSLEMVIGLLGILKAGGAYVPLDPGYPKERLSYMIQDSKAPVLLTQETLVEGLPKDVTRIMCLDSDWNVISKESSQNLSSGTTEDHLAYVIYTSGSTGQPKGVMIPHRAICNHMHWMQREFPLTEVDGVVQKTPFSFDASVWEFFAPLFVGARLIMARPGGHLDSTYLINLIAEQKATTLQLVPSMLQVLLDDKDFERCSSLRRVFCGGEALSTQLQERFFACLKAELHNLYGPTEASIDSTFWSCRRDSHGQTVPIGRPIANMQTYLLDSFLQPVPVGIPGELHLGGVGLARGYLNRPELTSEKFIRNPFSPDAEARLYKTGDLARYLPDGVIEFLGRVDHQVKVRGFRIELGEIESVLLQHPAVEKVVVLVREDNPGDQRVVAYVVSNKTQEADPGDLRGYLKARLPEYMVPSVFMLLDTLPVTPNGKVDRRALPVPDSIRSDKGKTYVPPRDPLEFRLTKIWEKVLNVDTVGVKDDFFELGGHSLLAVRLLAQIEKMAKEKLPLVTLFQAPTVEQLAEILRKEEWRAPWSSLVPLQPHGSNPPFFCVHAAAGNVLFYSDLARQLGKDQPFYGLQAMGLNGDQVPYDRVEEMAAYYIEEIRTVQPKGPYYLGGLSFGGTVAYEMAQQLRRKNENVALLALFDTYGPGYPRIKFTSLVRQKTNAYLQWLSKNFARFISLDFKDKRSFLKERLQNAKMRTERRVKKRIFKGKERLMTWAYKLYMRTGRPLSPQLRYIHVREADHIAHRVYRPQVYPDRMTIFRANKQPQGCRADPYLGWGKLVTGGVEVYNVPGSHSHSMIREPHVGVVVEKLKHCLKNGSIGTENI